MGWSCQKMLAKVGLTKNGGWPYKGGCLKKWGGGVGSNLCTLYKKFIKNLLKLWFPNLISPLDLLDHTTKLNYTTFKNIM